MRLSSMLSIVVHEHAIAIAIFLVSWSHAALSSPHFTFHGQGLRELFKSDFLVDMTAW
jgi:hypothetical protein